MFHHGGRFPAFEREFLRLRENVLESELFNIPLTVFCKMPSHGILPPAEFTATSETYNSFSDDPYMSPTFPLSPKGLVTYTAAPFRANVVEHGNGVSTTWFWGG